MIKLRKTATVLILIAVFAFFFLCIPAAISADPGEGDEAGGSVDVYPGAAGCTTTVSLHAWNSLGVRVIVWVFKGSLEELTEMDEPWPFLVYGTALIGDDINPDDYFDDSHEGCFTIDSDDWYKNIKLKLGAGNYLLTVVPLIEGEDGEGEDNDVDENIIFREFTVSGSCEEEEEEITIPWVRDVEMTCYQVWVNDNNNFEFIFFWEYASNNWVKIYDMEGNEVFSIDMKKGNARFEADLPDGMYNVKTFHDNFETPIQEFIIGKP